MDRNPVLQALIHRWRTGSVPGQRRDGLKIGLAIEGGAMRGVVSAGMLAALEYLGLLPAFDVVYGSSGGAINGAYFVSAQAGSGAAIYYENINNSRFISPLRFLCGGPLLSLNFLFEQAMTREKPLDWHKVVQSPIELVPVGTSVKTGKAVLLRGARSRESLFQRLKASAQIPFVASPPIRVADEEFFDGGLTAPIPVQPALEEGCTHVLALLTLPAGARPTPGSFLGRYFIARLAPSGAAGIVLANGSMSSDQSNEGNIRKEMIENDLIDCMVSLPAQLFLQCADTSMPVVHVTKQDKPQLPQQVKQRALHRRPRYGYDDKQEAKRAYGCGYKEDSRHIP